MAPFYITLLYLGLLQVCSSTISPNSLQAAVTIYAENDLQGSASNLTQAYLIVEQSPGSRPISCATFEESPLSSYPETPLRCTQSARYSNFTYADTSSRWWVEVQSGKQTFRGFRDRLSFRFLGVRYAPKPIRFGYPTPFTSNQLQSALTYGSECLQLPGVGSEDCLFLNIFTPYLPDTSKPTNVQKLKAAMLYIHGGGFIGGTGSDPEYDGGNMASRGDIVVVTINYRLGPFGFLPLNNSIARGNYGLADQVTALDWVRANIAAFGGDPNRITIAGQSAGAVSVHALLGSPQAVGKYIAAMPMSNLGGIGPLGIYASFPSIEEGSAIVATPVLSATNCSNAMSQVDCLREADGQVVLQAGGSILPPLVKDGKYVTVDALPLNGSGLVANVHLLLGILHDEAGALIPYPTATMNASEALAAVGLNPNLSRSYPELFPVPPGANSTLDIFNMTVRASTDGALRCPDQSLAVAGVRNHLFKSVWFYEYGRSYQPLSFEVNVPVCDAPIDASHPYGDTAQPYFRCHGGDVYYTFGNLIRQGRPARDNIDVPFSQFIVDLFTSFIRSSNPNPDPKYLHDRGYQSTLEEVTRPGGIWDPVSDANNPTLRHLNWPADQITFQEISQCDVLGV